MNQHILVIFILVAISNAQLCSLSKSNGSCICKNVADRLENSPAILADCARLNLEDVTIQDNVLKRVNILDMSHNNITKLAQKPEGFSSKSLASLDLSFNKIYKIDNGFFVDLPNLRKLILRNNDIASINSPDLFKNLNSLELLDLSFNNIKMLPELLFMPLVNLKNIDLSYNDKILAENSTQTSTFLNQYLGIQANITRLSLNHLGLSDPPNDYFEAFQQLKYLSIADNKFEAIPRVPYSVEYLDLSGTPIKTIQAKFLSYHSLKVFKLNRLKLLENIDRYAFYNLQSLEELYITDCYNLQEFNELVFGLLNKKNPGLSLKKLSLARNRLSTLNSTYKYLLDTLEYFDLSHNPWNCDCDLLWLKEYSEMARADYVQCSSPLYLRKKRVIDVADEDVPMCYPEKYGKTTHRILIPILILLIIVLTSLIGYLYYYAPTWYGMRGLIGPQSPYNLARVDEN